ncbi:MAG: S8 family serine peptidase, partial [Syntrophales bacterium LBB04]|nr:S8 family serine peptidase [Syntrophales bacterium LBB04]
NQAYTSDIVGSGGYSSGDYYTSFGGTSAASPYAAGSAAVLQQAAKARTGAYLTPSQVRSYLVNNGDNVTDSKVAVTKPRVNLGRAVSALPATSIQLSTSGYTVAESGGTVTITATRTGGSAGAVSISYATSNGTAVAGSDYTSTSGTLSWADGDTANKTFTVPIINDTLDEINETFTVTLSSPTGGATLGAPSSATVTITDDDPTPTVQFQSASSSGSEATTPAVITVTLSAASGLTVTVNYATSNGSATAGGDYTATSGTLTFNPGDTSKTISVPITNDTAVEGNETFTVTLSSPSNATLGGTTTHTYTIIDNDTPVWQSVPGASASPPALAWNPSANKQQKVVREAVGTIWTSSFDANGTV